MKVQVTLVSQVQGFTDAARKMDVGGGDQYPVRMVFDAHDALHRML